MVYGGAKNFDYIIETMGAGAAFLDFDNDGWLDIIMLTGRRLTDTPAEAVIRLYKNNRDGTFSDVTERSGLGRSVWAYGITIADYDNDGFDDIFITCWSQNILFHNNGDGTFSDVTEKAGLVHPGTRWGTGCTWVDYDRDGHLDLFVSNYINFSFETISRPRQGPGLQLPRDPGELRPPPACPRSAASSITTTVMALSRTSARRPASPKWIPDTALPRVAADFDEDGWPDILRRLRHHLQPALPQQSRRHLLRGGPGARRGT